MRIADIVKKDLLVVLRDFRALIFIFIMPIVLITILSISLGGIFQNGFSIGQINIAVVDETDPTEAAAVRQQLGAYAGESFDVSKMSIYSVLDSEEIKAFLNYKVTDAQDAQGLLDGGSADAIVTIPKGYTLQVTQSMILGGGTEIRVTGSQQKTLQSGIVAGIVRSYAQTISAISADMQVLISTLAQNGKLSQDTIKNIDIGTYIQNSLKASVQKAVNIISKGIEARKPLDSFMYYSIAITCMFTLYSAGQGSTFLYTESEEKTLHRLSASGLSKRKLLFGKSTAVFLLCILQLIVLFAYSALAFGIGWGDPLALIAISVCIALSVTGLGVLLMVLVYRSGNPRIGFVFQALFVQIFALFGGSYVPLSVLPKFFSTVALITPNGLAINALTGNVTGAPFTEVLPYLAGSVALGAGLYILGVLLFPRERMA